MKILIMGCGSIGERHLNNLLHLGYKNISCFDTSEEKLKHLEKKYGVETYSDMESAFKAKYDLCLVCTPTSFHMASALMALKNGSHVFIEKPLSDSLEGVEEIIKESNKRKLKVMVGYNFRFNNCIRKIKDLLEANRIGKIINFHAELGQYMPEWRPSVDYRTVYSANKNMGGGIILDAVHEIDYICWFFGKVRELFCFSDKRSSLDIDVEDVADIFLRFENGIFGTIHLNSVERTYNRGCKIIGEEGTIRWDFKKGSIQLFTVQSKKWTEIKDEEDAQHNDTYLKEIEHFIGCIKNDQTPISGLSNGIYTLSVALAAKRSSEAKKMIEL